MTVRYHTRNGQLIPSYVCQRKGISTATPTARRHRRHDRPGDRHLLLDTVTPLALEVALTVQAELEARAEEADQLRAGRHRTRPHAAELARRRYLAVDPDNRLVAATLEADWNDALRQHTPPPKTLRTSPRHHRRAHRPAATRIAALAQLPRAVVRPAHPPAGTQTHGPPAHRRRHPRQRPTTSASTSASAAGRPPASPSPSQPPAGRPTPDPPRHHRRELDRLLDDHTDAETADASTPPDTAPAPLSSAEPVRPIDWVTLALAQAWANSSAVYSLPWSVWKITPATSPPRIAIATHSAARASSAS
jgi:hypothetical protein